MINTEKLKEIIEASGLPVEFLAEQLNRSEEEARAIIDGANEPMVRDIEIFKAFLNLSNDDIDEIFFKPYMTE